jgi:hypothetical protein
MKRGWKVSLPFGDDCRYDVVVDTPKGLCRVQVKSCNKTDDRGRYRVNAGHGRLVKKAYEPSDCDVIAVYVSPLKHWWLVPTEKVRTTHLDLSLHHNECYDAWHNIHAN